MLRRLFFCVPITLLIAGCTPTAGGSAIDTPAANESSDHSAIESNEVAEVPASEASGTAEITGGDEAALRRFLEHYLAHPGIPGTMHAYIGSLPEELPIELPMPENADIIGSVVSNGQLSYTQILIDAASPQSLIEQFYTDTFSGEEWTQPQTSSQGGFVAGTTPQLTFCHASSDTFVTVMAQEQTSGITNISITFQEGLQYSPCAVGAYAPPQGDASSKIPRLIPPTGAQQQQQGGGGGAGTDFIDAYQSATILTSLTAIELSEHYNDQIEAEGWTLASSGGNDDTAWSTWMLIDDQGNEWTSRLIVFRRGSQEDGLFAWIQVEQRR